MRRAIVILGSVLVLACAVLLLTVQLRWQRTFTAPYPALAAESDPAVVARGKYLVYGPGNCAYCHVPKELWPALDAGETPPLAGNHVFPLPFGRAFSANLTPDPETGIGRRTDGELARILRHGVRADGRAALPFMEYHQMSDADLVAVISFLRTQPPVRNPVPEHDLNLLGRALMALVIKPPPAVEEIPAASPAPEATVARGAYLANAVAGCAGCHTQRNLMDGRFTGPVFAGGLTMDIADDPTRVFVTPNLTPDSATGIMAGWSEERFLARFRQGTTIPGSLMPWGAYVRISDADLQALYRYLRSLPPVSNATGPVVRAKKGTSSRETDE